MVWLVGVKFEHEGEGGRLARDEGLGGLLDANEDRIESCRFS